MSNDEYVALELKRLIATLYFKYVASGVRDGRELISNEEAIKMADKLLKDLSRS